MISLNSSAVAGPRKSYRGMPSVLALVGLSATLFVQTVGAQSLGEIAKRTQETKEKTKPTPAKSYKNGDLTADPTAPKVEAPTDATTPAPATQPAKADSKTTSDS